MNTLLSDCLASLACSQYIKAMKEHEWNSLKHNTQSLIKSRGRVLELWTIIYCQEDLEIRKGNKWQHLIGTSVFEIASSLQRIFACSRYCRDHGWYRMFWEFECPKDTWFKDMCNYCDRFVWFYNISLDYYLI